MILQTLISPVICTHNLLVLCGLLLVLPGQFALCEEQQSYTLPFELKRGNITFFAHIHNQKAELILDTGTTNTTLLQASAKRWKMRVQPFDAMLRKHPGAEMYKGITFAPLYLGDWGPFEIPFLVLPRIKHSPLQFSFDSILGINFLTRCAFLIDPKQKKLTFLWPGNIPKEELKRLNMSQANEIILREAHGLFWVPVTLNDTLKVDMFLDTGMARTSLSWAQSQLLQIPPGKRDTVITVKDKLPVFHGVLKSLQIGNVTLKELPIRCFEQSSPVKEKEKGESDGSTSATRLVPGSFGILGMDVLQQFRIIIDLPARRMYLLAIE